MAEAASRLAAWAEAFGTALAAHAARLGYDQQPYVLIVGGGHRARSVSPPVGPALARHASCGDRAFG